MYVGIKNIKRGIGCLFLFFFVMNVQAATKAPEWHVSEWINGGGGTLSSKQGKVLVIDFFQMWCPGCNNFSIPLVKRWHKKYAEQIAAGQLEIISIHTVFEGHDMQSPQRLRRFLKRKGIRHTVGIDLHMSGEMVPETMKLWNNRGTPEMAIVDKQGMIRFKKFGGFESQPVEALIERLLVE